MINSLSRSTLDWILESSDAALYKNQPERKDFLHAKHHVFSLFAGDSGRALFQLLHDKKLFDVDYFNRNAVIFYDENKQPVKGTILHGLFTKPFLKNQQILDAVVFVCSLEPSLLNIRNSSGFTPCGHLNLILSGASAKSSHILRTNIIQCFEKLVSLGADPTQLGADFQGAANDPLILSIAQSFFERQELDAATQSSHALEPTLKKSANPL